MLNAFAEKKLKFKLPVVFVSAILCGVIMGLISAFSMVTANISPDNKILSKVIYGVAFTGLLFLVLLNNYELFTGNTMLLATIRKDAPNGVTKKILLNLLFVYVGNFIGCVLAAVLLYLCNLHTLPNMTEYLTALYNIKVNLPIPEMLLMGFFANYLVCMGVYQGGKGKTSVETYVRMFFPIVVFCVLGFEHSVANMFSLFYAAFVTGEPVGPIFLNLLFVTIGNVVGGVTFAFSTYIKDSGTVPVAPVDDDTSTSNK